ncbi:MAG: zf-HC2 domain-containing protein [Anaerolineae bacterium]
MTNSPLNCKESVELVTDYLEGALLPELQNQLEQHLSTCPACTTYLAQMRQTIQTLRLLADETIPVETRQQLLQTFKEWHKGQPPEAWLLPRRNDG